MEKNQNSIVIALLVLVIGFGAGYVLHGATTPAPRAHMMSNGAVMSDDEEGMESAMGSMMSGLAGKTGDAFDQAFLAEMIVHHQGAVSMAEAALKSAKHTELQAMARAIISAQTTEITQMQSWQETWYGQ